MGCCNNPIYNTTPPDISVSFNGDPGMQFTQGEDRTFTVSLFNNKLSLPVDLTGAVVDINLPLQGGGSIKRTNGPVTVLQSQIELTGGVEPGIVTFTDHGFVTGDPVQVASDGTLPAPLQVATPYTIVVLDVNTFEFADANGVVIPLTDIGTAEFTITNSTDIVLSGTPVLGQLTFSLRGAVSSQVNALRAQSFQVAYTINSLTRIVVISGQLDVINQPVP